MKKLIFIGILTLSMIFALTACKGNESEEAVTPDSAATVPQDTSLAPADKASTGKPYYAISAVEVPPEYPTELLPLSDDDSDKIMIVYTADDSSVFDYKIATTRSAKEVVEDYAKRWELEDENTIIMEDQGSATLVGTYQGYEVIVNGSENSPDLPEGAKTYVAILVEKAE
ncbi:hypothetical protein SDC9_64177 [bioreactor metagenome]|uniref:Uncharacterized protein n=1 Tax=bioreactor metagenome TaxID=1076179 RepID=A0A644XPV6_9ZZZZ